MVVLMYYFVTVGVIRFLGVPLARPIWCSQAMFGFLGVACSQAGLMQVALRGLARAIRGA